VTTDASAGAVTRQIFSGLGAGNIGDEFMARAFWQQLPPTVSLQVVLDPESVRQRAPYPPPHSYTTRGRSHAPAARGLLVGTTPVTEDEGLGWPLRFLAGELRGWHERGAAVDALGVGVDRLASRRALQMFREAFLPIRSWTVRSPRCRDALLAMGVPADRVELGADWAWLYSASRPLREWAAAVWRRLGIDPERPLVIVNVVNLRWRRSNTKRQLASALDAIAARFDMQIAFFCNECRDGRHYDAAAARDVAAYLRRPAAIVPNAYYAPDEVLALFRSASLTVGQRYHVIVQSVLAGVPPVAIVRGQKMRALAEDTQTPVGGSVDHVDADQLAETMAQVLIERDRWPATLQRTRERLAARARRNLAFWPAG
jgi:polysaccharide pyruvyl transferase WcaK-like protein